jgi:hypothetical protein
VPLALPAVPPRAFRAFAGALCLGALLALPGCATMMPGAQATPTDAGAGAPPVPANVEPPPPAINLSGFPLPYRQGYADGCASAGGREQKDAARFTADGNYRTGWTDGRALCAKK